MRVSNEELKTAYHNGIITWLNSHNIHTDLGKLKFWYTKNDEYYAMAYKPSSYYPTKLMIENADGTEFYKHMLVVTQITPLQNLFVY